MNDNRFYVATDKLAEVTDALLHQGFTEQDACLDNYEELSSHIFIDSLKKTFYHTDEECLKQTSLILIEKFQKTYSTTTLKKIKKWQK